MKILAIGAHADDIELYCGGSLLKAINEGNEVRCVICSSSFLKGRETAIQEQKSCWKEMGITNSYLLGFKNRFLKHDGDLVAKLDAIISDYAPDVVFSHSELDSNQDHIAVAKAVRSSNRFWSFNWITYASYDIRNALIPNLFIDITPFYKKKKQLLAMFHSQNDRWYFNEDVLLARSLGTKVGKYAEFFKIEYMFIK